MPVVLLALLYLYLYTNSGRV